jgi:hypothetical protein
MYTGGYIFFPPPKKSGATKNPRLQKGDMQQVPYWVRTNFSRHGEMAPEMCAHLYVRIYVLHVCVSIYVCMYVCIYVYTYVCTFFLSFFFCLFFLSFLPSFFLFLFSCFKKLNCQSYLYCCSPRNKLQNNADNTHNTSQDIIIVVATMLWAGRLKDCTLISDRSQWFVVSQACILVLEPIPPFLKRAMGALPLGVKRSGRKTHHSCQSCMCSHGMHTHNFVTSIRSRGSLVNMVRGVFQCTWALILHGRYNKIPMDVCLPIQYGKVSCHNYKLSLDMK